MRRLAFSLALVGCFDPNSEGGTLDQYDDDDLPSGVCRDTGTDTDPCDTEGTTIGPGAGAAEPPDRADACEASADCMSGVCVAPFDAATLERGDLICRFACVPLLDDTAWCSDDASCCVEGARCTDRGYCVMIEE